MWSESEEQISEGEVLQCLLVGTTFKPEKSGRPNDQMWFMVLRELEYTEEEYTRIGVAVMQINRDEPCLEFLDQFVDADWITIV